METQPAKHKAGPAQSRRALGILTSNLNLYGPSHLLAGIEREARRLGYNLLISSEPRDAIRSVEDVLEGMFSRLVEGVIWADGGIDAAPESWERKLHGLGIPVLLVGVQSETGLPFVSIDNRAGARIAVDHLLSQGYRHIGLITGAPMEWVSRQRQLGWQDALTTAGIVPESRQIVAGNWYASSGEQGLRQLLRQFPEIDAVFAGNDQTALGVLKAASDLGLAVPDDLGVVGFDDIPDAACFLPPLTTIRQQLVEMGAAAVRELDCLVLSQRASVQNSSATSRPLELWFRPELVVRKSSLRAARRAAAGATMSHGGGSLRR